MDDDIIPLTSLTTNVKSTFAEQIAEKYKKSNSGPKTPRLKDSIVREMTHSREQDVSKVTGFAYPQKLIYQPPEIPVKSRDLNKDDPKISIKKSSSKISTPILDKVDTLIKSGREPAIKKLSQTAQSFISQSAQLPLQALQPNDLSEDERRQSAYFAYVNLSQKNPIIKVPDNWSLMPIDQLERMIRQAEIQHKKKDRVSHMETYLIAGSFLIQVLGGNIMDLDGYVKHQMDVMGNYRSALAELGDSEPSLTGEDWSPWSKLLFLILFNTIIFILSKKITSNPQSVLSSFYSVRNSTTGAETPAPTGGNPIMTALGSMFGGSGAGGGIMNMLGSMMGGGSQPAPTGGEEEVMTRPRSKYTKKPKNS